MLTFKKSLLIFKINYEINKDNKYRDNIFLT